MAPHPSRPDRRRAIRLPVHGEIEARLLSTNQRLELRDFGSGGFLADTDRRVTLDSVDDVVLTSRNGLVVVTLRARCAHSRHRTELRNVTMYAVGFAFLSPNDRDVDALLDLLTQAAPTT
jgi:hypothetical protein